MVKMFETVSFKIWNLFLLFIIIIIQIYNITHGVEKEMRVSPSLKRVKPGAIQDNCLEGNLKQKVSQLIIKLWNSLSQDVAMGINLDGFKRGGNKFMEDLTKG